MKPVPNHHLDHLVLSENLEKITQQIIITFLKIIITAFDHVHGGKFNLKPNQKGFSEYFLLASNLSTTFKKPRRT